jgi:glycosyltransferase involved in cell wall biosynthesis
MKVLHITPTFYPAQVYGGPIESTYQLCRSLASSGCDVRVLTTDANGPQEVLDVPTYREVQIAEGMRVRYCHRQIRDSVSITFLRLLPSYIHWADVVHLTAVYSFPTIPTLLSCRPLHKAVVWSLRGALQRWEGSSRVTTKALWERVCRVVAPEKTVLHVTSQQEAVASLKRFPGVETVVIPNGIEIPEKVAHARGNGILRLLYLGRLHPIKGLEILLLSCKRLNDVCDLTWSLTIAGDGEPGYVQVLRARIDGLKLEERVKMIGAVNREAKQMLFENSDIVVVPSHTENFGMVVAEALAHGVPVIASKGTPWRRVEGMGCGLWVENDPESLAKAIERMSKMPLREMGQRAREWMEKEFSWSDRAQDMMKLYESLARGNLK